ncbi:SpdD-like protein [Streptomyces sp. B-S-A8]|uniref:SpdD-like protein n=1 Tax=Streptomyces solicavernae TaxID=3043614 RepID=A0ABT6RRI0_9ACTN|nr:SpdD-like protein [Streptomyces sp. B-S-A8]MDI3387050.1 SpdD-like protein [Streptomyces sp. B-S-A8]
MLTPKIPVNDQPTGDTIPLTGTALEHQPQTPAPAPVAPAAPARPTVQLTPGSLALLVGGGTAAVLVVGAVLVSMLLAAAIAGVSVAVTAVVLRHLVNNLHKDW